MTSRIALFRAISASLVVSVGCAHATASVGDSAPNKTYPFTASSLGGKYLLKGAFNDNVTIRGDSIIVAVPMALLANQMRTAPAHSPLFRDVAVQVYVAIPDGNSWRVAAQSAQVSVAPLGMNADTTMSVAPLRLAIPQPHTPLGRAWLAFQLSAHHLPGSPLYRDEKTALHTYVCSGQYLLAAPGDSTLVSRHMSDSPLTC